MTRMTSYGHVFSILVLTIVATFCANERANAQSAQQEAVGAVGFQRGRSYFSPESFEHYDTVSGNVLLSFADLSLPGNAGRSLTFQRTYNNQRDVMGQASRWSFGFPGIVMRVAEKTVPSNYNFDDNAALIIATTPDFEMSDGSVHHTMYVTRPNPATAATMEVRSAGFYLYDRQYHFLKMPDGTICYYDTATGRLTSFHDQFGNVVDLIWTTGSVVVSQHLGNGQDREVTLTLDAESRVTAMQFENRTWEYDYDHEMDGVFDITSVTLPAGPGWTFTYDDVDITTITTPNGGLISYTYQDIDITDPTMTYADIHQRSLVARDSSGRDVTTGHWTIDWLADPGNSFAWSTHIVTPSGTRVVYEHGIQVISQDISRVIGGNFGVLKRSVFDGQQRIDFERYTFQAVPVIQYTSPSVWWGTAEPDERIVERDGRTYSTRFFFDNVNFGDYHHPNAIVEEGDLTRTTLLTYHHYQTPSFVVGLPATAQVTINGGPPVSSSWAHDSLTGFVTAATAAGITTTFEKDTFGNVSRVIKANGKSVSYGYSWAQISSIATAEHTTTRSINPNGTVASETRAGRTTEYEYDNLFRVLSVQPPGGTNPFVTTYDNDTGAWTRTTRGSSVKETTLDAFGRAIKTTDSLGIRTVTRYDPEGRTVFEGYPVETADQDIGTSIEYDKLSRVTRLVNPGAGTSVRTRAYGPGTVTLTDENGHSTVQTFLAFGHPDDGRLELLHDADGHDWNYIYNTSGRLSSVAAEDGITRSWTYYTSGLIHTETNPESGTTTYVYDAAGVLAQKTDAKGTVFQYNYDGNDRLRTIATGSEWT